MKISEVSLEVAAGANDRVAQKILNQVEDGMPGFDSEDIHGQVDAYLIARGQLPSYKRLQWLDRGYNVSTYQIGPHQLNYFYPLSEDELINEMLGEMLLRVNREVQDVGTNPAMVVHNILLGCATYYGDSSTFIWGNDLEREIVQRTGMVLRPDVTTATTLTTDLGREAYLFPTCVSDVGVFLNSSVPFFQRNNKNAVYECGVVVVSKSLQQFLFKEPLQKRYHLTTNQWVNR